MATCITLSSYLFSPSHQQPHATWFLEKEKERLIEVSKDLGEDLHGVEKRSWTIGEIILRLKCQWGDSFAGN